MIVTTTPSIEGKRITDYKGVVFGEVISGVDVIKDFTAGLSNFFGGRSATTAVPLAVTISIPLLAPRTS